jgi:hypothetical protein
LVASFFAHDFLACFVVVVRPTTIFWSSSPFCGFLVVL